MTTSLFTADDALFFSLEMADMTNDQLIAVARAEYHTAPMGKVRAMSVELEERLGWDKARAVFGTAHVAA
jgi:hypothetical protein